MDVSLDLSSTTSVVSSELASTAVVVTTVLTVGEDGDTMINLDAVFAPAGVAAAIFRSSSDDAKSPPEMDEKTRAEFETKLKQDAEDAAKASTKNKVCFRGGGTRVFFFVLNS